MAITIATYKNAQKLWHALSKLSVPIKAETLDMTTSGIYIPRWLGYQNIPYSWNPTTQIAEWFFFYRFGNGHPDMNVQTALSIAAKPHGIKNLANSIKSWKPTVC